MKIPTRLPILVRFSAALMLTTATLTVADDFDGVRGQIRSAMAEQNIPSIAVAVAHKGKIVWEEGFGWADVAKRIPATAHTPYSLASISKPVTATALMILVERGAIDLDKPMDDYLGKQKLTARVGSAGEATVRRVANHTSGLPLHYQFFYEDEPVPRPTMEESIRRYGTLVRAPGENFAYSNFGYGLLEYAIERASGRPYAEFLRDNLFAPLGLSESAVNRIPDLGNRVASRYRNNRAVPFYDFDHRGASAVFMSAHDLVRFGMFHLQGRLEGQPKTVLQRSTLASMWDNPVPTYMPKYEKSGYGVGWMVEERHGLKRIGHSGGMAGVSTELSFYPDADLVVVVLTNMGGVSVPDISGGIVHAVLPDTIRHDHEFKPQPELVGRWKGAVHAYAGDTPLELDFKDNGGVFARVGDGPQREVTSVKLDPKTSLLSLNGIEGSVNTPDAAHYPYLLNFSLKLRTPDTLNGAVSAVSRSLPDRLGNALSYWTELRRSGATHE